MTSEDTAENGYDKQSRFWLNLPPLLFDTYQDLVRAYADMDTRAIYIVTFAQLLSLALPQEMDGYEEFATIKSRSPLPEDPLEKISFGDYSEWLRALRLIMRRAGIIGGEKTVSTADAVLDDSVMIFDDLQVI